MYKHITHAYIKHTNGHISPIYNICINAHVHVSVDYDGYKTPVYWPHWSYIWILLTIARVLIITAIRHSYIDHTQLIYLDPTTDHSVSVEYDDNNYKTLGYWLHLIHVWILLTLCECGLWRLQDTHILITPNLYLNHTEHSVSVDYDSKTLIYWSHPIYVLIIPTVV